MKRLVQQRNVLAKAGVKSPVREVRKGPQVSSTATFIETIEGLEAPRVLVIRTMGGIGDVLMCTPALRELKSRFPKANLTFAINRHSTGDDSYWAITKNAPFIDQIIDARYALRKNYDAVVDLTSPCILYERKELPVRNRIDIFADTMGLVLKNHLPFYKVEQNETIAAKQFLAGLPDRWLVFLHTASFDQQRSWPLERYFELVETAPADLHFLVSDFNHRSKRWQQYQNCTDVSNTTVREMAALISQVDLFVGPDSGPMHLSGALSIPSVVLFGSIPPQARINYYPTHTAVVTGLSCSPCWYRQCPYSFKCMTDISVSKVLDAINKF